ncbi:MAG TPA: Fe-S cluster assembly protein SufD [Gammaproteobacteria bacterium]|nr:Fe-S cluster assembly protein SufD [Gammaproteobacteria bacterium]
MSMAPYREAFAAYPTPQAWVQTIKEAALQRASASGYPTTRDEAWKYTSMAALEKRGFKPVASEAKLDTAELASLLIPGLDYPRAVFVNGRFDAKSSRLPKGIRIVSARAADESLRTLLPVSKLWEDDVFLNLNTALFQDALMLELSADTRLDVPFELLHVSVPGSEPASHQLRCIVKLGTHADATLVERYVGLAGAKHLTNSVVQVHLDAGAKLTHLRLQDEDTQGFHVGRILVQQAADSSYISHNVQIGAAWSRLDLAVDLEAAGAHAELNGLYAVNDQQHVDNHTSIKHAAPHTTSRELYRGILDGHGRAVFNGKVQVAKHAVKTDSAQANHNLLLSPGAEIDTKPELEIYADDVKCAHGATIGQLDEQQLFYLRSRGLDADAARVLLVGAFAERLVSALPLPAVAAHLRQRLGASIRQLNGPVKP